VLDGCVLVAKRVIRLAAGSDVDQLLAAGPQQARTLYVRVKPGLDADIVGLIELENWMPPDY
jgi:hypothetical protein